jgi:hypothetical protein
MAATIDDVEKIATALEGVKEIRQYGRRAWAANEKAFAWVRPFTKADLKRFGDEEPPAGPIVAVRVADLMEKEAALAANPKSFFTIPHFDGHPAVLIQLDAVDKRTLAHAVKEAWRAVTSSKAPARRARPRAK